MNALWTARSKALVTLCSALAVVLLAAAVAHALVYSDITDFNVCDNSITDAGNFSTSSGNNGNVVEYRWLDDPNHTTVISANDPYTLFDFGDTAIPAHNTGYRTVASYVGFTNTPPVVFKLRGRTASGAGCMYNHDGRVNR